MARKSGTKNELVKCEYCGEMYSTTYKRCPFCNEDGTGPWAVAAAEEEDELDYDAPRGGRRLAGGKSNKPRRQSVGSIIGWVLSAILIIAAGCIVFSLVRAFLGLDKDKRPTPTPTPPAAESVEPTPSEPVDTPPAETDDPVESEPPQPTIPSIDIVTPTSFTINKNDVTFSHAGEQWSPIITLVPADATAEIIWKSSDPNIAAVSYAGKVTAVGRGTCTITATIEGVGEQSCIVRCNFTETATNTGANPNPNTSTGEEPTVSGLTISRTDFTLSSVGDHWRLVIEGTDSTVTWTSSDPGVATVDETGMVTAVSKGTCTVTAEVDGVKLTCIVRCNF